VCTDERCISAYGHVSAQLTFDWVNIHLTVWVSIVFTNLALLYHVQEGLLATPIGECGQDILVPNPESNSVLGGHDLHAANITPDLYYI
jgi:hypothetical protein